MENRRLNHKLNRAFRDRVHAETNNDNRSILLTGELPDWDAVIRACRMAVSRKKGWHVVNHIRCPEAPELPMKLPKERDTSLQGCTPDVLIIGGGVIGCALLRELSRYRLSLLLLEKESDLAVQASSRNDGEIHPGVDQKTRTLKLQYELQGNRLFPEVCRQLSVPFRKNGQYVAFREWWAGPLLRMAALKKRLLGVKDTCVVTRKKLYQALPHLAPGYRFGLYNPSAGTVCPYGLTIAYAENAVQNGAEIALNTAVMGMKVEEGRILSVQTNRGEIRPKLVINAAGVFSDRIAEMAGDGFFSIHPRRGTEMILDRKKGDLTDPVVSSRSILRKGPAHTKGGGILHTVDGNILVGPDAEETPLREDFSTRPDSVRNVMEKQKRTIDALDARDIITWFTGIRAATFEEDFILERGRLTENILHCAGIQSPGLTAAPAIARDMSALAVSMLGGAELSPDFDPVRKPIPRLRDMDDEERSRLIRKDPNYGIIVCRCEEISKGEILDALRSPVPVPTLDGIKRRVRPGMGRCQGGFCGPLVAKIIAEEQGIPLSEVTKSGGGSFLSLGGTKE